MLGNRPHYPLGMGVLIRVVGSHGGRQNEVIGLIRPVCKTMGHMLWRTCSSHHSPRPQFRRLNHWDTLARRMRVLAWESTIQHICTSSPTPVAAQHYAQDSCGAISQEQLLVGVGAVGWRAARGVRLHVPQGCRVPMGAGPSTTQDPSLTRIQTPSGLRAWARWGLGVPAPVAGPDPVGILS